MSLYMVLLIQSSEIQFSGNEIPPPTVPVLLFKRGFVWCLLWTQRWGWVVVIWWHHSGTGSSAFRTSWSTSEGSDLPFLPPRSTDTRPGEVWVFLCPSAQGFNVGWHHFRELSQWERRKLQVYLFSGVKWILYLMFCSPWPSISFVLEFMHGLKYPSWPVNSIKVHLAAVTGHHPFFWELFGVLCLPFSAVYEAWSNDYFISVVFRLHACISLRCFLWGSFTPCLLLYLSIKVALVVTVTSARSGGWDSGLEGWSVSCSLHSWQSGE